MEVLCCFCISILMAILDHSNGEMNPYLTTKMGSNYYFMKIMAAILTSKCLLFNFLFNN